MSPNLTAYLQNHEAAGQAGHDLFRRVASGQRHRTYGRELHDLADEVRDDLASLRTIMAETGVHPNPLLAMALRIGERVGRLKPNGTLIRRAPVTDLVEIEALVTIVHAKRNAWTALAAVPHGREALDPGLLATMSGRADDQIDRLAIIHGAVSARLLS